MLSKDTHFFRAAGLMAATSVLVPLVGLATAPILAHALGVAGRGTVAAALAPNVLVASVATLGLPEALTFHLANAPGQTGRALRTTAIISTVVGAGAFVVVAALAVPLSGGVRGLAGLIAIATALAIPQLIVNLLRGAAIGRGMWRAVAAERVGTSVLRLLSLVLLLLLGALDVLNAVLVSAIVPIAAGLAYWRVARVSDRPYPPGGTVSSRGLLGYGSRIWLGSVASIAMSRLGPLLITPLSDVRQLGLLTAAVAIADVPFIVSTSVRDVVFGADSAERDAERLAFTTRISTSAAVLGSLVLGSTLPLWIETAFGPGFRSAVLATWVLLASVVVNVPGWMSGAGLSGWGKPELRSIGLVAALVSNLIALVLFVPSLGALGAALASLVGAVVVSGFTVHTAARVVGVRRRDLLLLRASDGALALKLFRSFTARRARE